MTVAWLDLDLAPRGDRRDPMQGSLTGTGLALF